MARYSHLILFAVLFLSLSPWALALNEPFSIVVLPDTQKYAEKYPEVFTAQTEWIAENVEELNIVFVSHEGDIVENNESEKEWVNADKSLSILDGIVPYGVLPGNHDFGKTDFFNKYFPPERFSSYPWFGGSFPEEKNNNNFQLFSASGYDFVILHLEMCPSDEAVEWADSVLKANPERRAIITTHGYLNGNAERRVHGCGERDGNMQYLWEDLIYPNPNVFLVLCGHVHSEASRIDPNIEGKPVFQLLADYQGGKKGGNGFLRILTFFPSDELFQVKTYSPWLDEFKEDGDSFLVLWFEPAEKSPLAPTPLSLAGLAIALAMFLMGAYLVFWKGKK